MVSQIRRTEGIGVVCNGFRYEEHVHETRRARSVFKMPQPDQRGVRKDALERHLGIIEFARLHIEYAETVFVVFRACCLRGILCEQAVRGHPPIRDLGIDLSVHVDRERLARRKRRIDGIGDRIRDRMRALSRIDRAESVRIDAAAVRYGDRALVDFAAVARSRRNGGQHDHLRAFQNADRTAFRRAFVIIFRLYAAEIHDGRRTHCRECKRIADAFRRNGDRNFRSSRDTARKRQFRTVCGDQVFRGRRDRNRSIFAREIIGRFKGERKRARSARDPICFHFRFVRDRQRIERRADGKRNAVRTAVCRDRDDRRTDLFRFQTHAVYADHGRIARGERRVGVLSVER